jgi:hypothetical protein
MIVTSTFQADATRGFGHLRDADELSPGFFDDTQVNAHVRHQSSQQQICPDNCSQSSVKPRAHPNFSALLGRFSSFLHPH